VPAAPQPLPPEPAVRDRDPAVRDRDPAVRERDPKAAKLALALLAAVGLFGAGFATSTWLRVGASGTQAPPPAEMQTDEAKQAPVAADPGRPPDVATVAPSAPPSPSPIAPAEPAAVEPRSTAASSTAAPPSSAAREVPKSAPRKANKESEARVTKGKARVRGETKRYSPRNSEVMRLFCEGSGRATPQCRTFLRETRGSRR
jgi:hypothetical protein